MTVGGKEYVLGEGKNLDIEYGADIFDLMRKPRRVCGKPETKRM